MRNVHCLGSRFFERLFANCRSNTVVFKAVNCVKMNLIVKLLNTVNEYFAVRFLLFTFQLKSLFHPKKGGFNLDIFFFIMVKHAYHLLGNTIQQIDFYLCKFFIHYYFLCCCCIISVVVVQHFKKNIFFFASEEKTLTCAKKRFSSEKKNEWKAFVFFCVLAVFRSLFDRYTHKQTHCKRLLTYGRRCDLSKFQKRCDVAWINYSIYANASR